MKNYFVQDGRKKPKTFSEWYLNLGINKKMKLLLYIIDY